VRRYRRAVDTLDAAVAAALARRRTEGDRGGLIDHLADALPADQVRDQALILTLGGYESATSALCWALLILGREAEVRRRLVEELRTVLGDRPAAPEDAERLPFARQVLSEVMRLYPPPWLIPRACPGGDRLPSGLELPAGAMLFLSPWRVQRDERFFREPLRFDPDRWSEGAPPAGAYFPFGLGSRRCTGEGVAWKQLALILASLCRRWRFVCDGLPAPRPLLTLRPPSPLWVRIEAV
jgi:cytochrome P450